MPIPALRLGVNIDHAATLRNARDGVHPDPVRAARTVLAAGADSITFHLREDRRHIRDDDVRRLKAEITAPLNFEMAATDEMVAIALATKPHACCLVPERRTERTTEGGLDVVGALVTLGPKVAQLAAGGIRVSLFIAPDPAQIAAAADVRAPAIEFHTGRWADLVAAGENAEADAEFARLIAGAKQAQHLGIEVHAGHGLDYATSEKIAAVPEIVELNTGHFIMGEALFVGLPAVIREMRAAMDRGRARAGLK